MSIALTLDPDQVTLSERCDASSVIVVTWEPVRENRVICPSCVLMDVSPFALKLKSVPLPSLSLSVHGLLHVTNFIDRLPAEGLNDPSALIPKATWCPSANVTILREVVVCVCTPMSSTDAQPAPKAPTVDDVDE